jgi:ribonuclease-3
MIAKMNFQALEERLSYVFADKSKLKQACTHRSYSRDNNERLEFLGDVVLSAVLSEHLFRQEAELSEGELTRKRAMLVRGKTLVEIAQQIDLGKYLLLGDSERAGGRGRASILEDTLEAVIAAIYLDGGWSAVTQVILCLWQEKLAEKVATIEKDAKTQLQEWLQARSLPLPLYETDVFGPGHQQVFLASCRVVGIDSDCKGEGKTKREAEQAAARKMQLLLENQ